MAKILQIRRGSSVQHDKFTGMNGEITFDTDAKTIRVHDGQTVGGFALARKDEITGGTEPAPEFDINSVPAEFWEALFEQYQKDNSIKTIDSPLVPVKTQAGVSYGFSEIEKCFYCEVILVCQTSEAGYTPGDEVRAWGIGNRGRPEANIVKETKGISLMLLLGQENFWVRNKTNGQIANITNENWQLLFRVYY